ncbi:MAG: YkoF family thiamine/hydroxymethylpyrimidine-binding protein [Pseudomonadota bacterium]
MIVTAELSLYPLADDYLRTIKAFIENLNEQAGLTVVTNAMSTQIRGESPVVFRAVEQLLNRSAEQFEDQVLVCKFIPKPLAIDAEVEL